jgi:hypothetical protein
MLVADMRPRTSSGVDICLMVCRITVLVISAAPVAARKIIAVGKLGLIPNPIVKIP